jgi:hypothetical protein
VFLFCLVIPRRIGHLHINIYFDIRLINTVLREFYEFSSGCRSCELATSCKSPPDFFTRRFCADAKRLLHPASPEAFFDSPWYLQTATAAMYSHCGRLICDPLAWLSELYEDREYIKSSILVLSKIIMS